MWRAVSVAVLGALVVQDSPSAADKAGLHEELAVAAEGAGDQLLKLKAWDEARAFLELIRAKSDARSEALDKLIAKTDKQTSGLKWDAKSSDLIKSFGGERAKKFFAFARAWKEKDVEASRWTQAEGEILDDLLDYVKAYSRLTQIRAHYELPKTRFDWKLSVPAVWHAKYEMLNPDDTGEIEGKPGYSREGKMASANSITSSDESMSELLEGLFHAPYYRNYILHPSLKVVGCGQALKGGSSSVLDVLSGIGPPNPDRGILLSPKDKAVNIALSGYDDHVRIITDKSMKTLGYPISVMFYDPKLTPKEVTARISERMRDIEFYLSTPEKPLVAKGTPNQETTIALIPKEPLKPEAEYKISIRFVVNGAERTIEWTFRTSR